jgi:hypothetical protein
MNRRSNRISIIYHALEILLQRPFLSNGHLAKDFQDNERAAGERICINAALKIWRLVESYKTAFTLRRAPYIVCYCVYSSAVAILNQTLFERSRFTKCMAFFWSALTDLRRGCNFGLQKPLDILKDMMVQFGEDIPTQDGIGTLHSISSEKGAELQEERIAGRTDNQFYSGSQGSHVECQQWAPSVQWEPDPFGSEMEYDDWPLNDMLYGLVTPGQAIY